MPLLSTSSPGELGKTKPHIDRWIASSILQKGIRRGTADLAERAGILLLRSEPTKFWQRLGVIALEDIGRGDYSLVARVVSTALGSRLTRGERTKRKACELIGLMCASVKSRFADELLVTAALAPQLRESRARCRTGPDQHLQETLHTSPEPAEQALAAWFLAGTNRFWMGSNFVRPGNLPLLWQTYAELGVPEQVLEPLRTVATRIRWPLAVILPLAWLSLGVDEATIERNPLPPYQDLDGIPAFALDRYTRLGGRAISRLATECEPVREYFAKQQIRTGITRIIGAGIFALEGETRHPRLVWPAGEEVRRQAIAADLEANGLPEGQAPTFLALLSNQLENLHQARRDVLRDAGHL